MVKSDVSRGVAPLGAVAESRLQVADVAANPFGEKNNVGSVDDQICAEPRPTLLVGDAIGLIRHVGTGPEPAGARFGDDCVAGREELGMLVILRHS